MIAKGAGMSSFQEKKTVEELNVIEAEARKTDAMLKIILKKIGIGI